MKKIFVISLLLVLSHMPLALSDFEMPKVRDHLNFKFVFTESKNPPKATIQVDDTKSSVRFDFEGTRLKSGRYRIIAVEHCDEFKTNLFKTKVYKGEELFSFETEFGEISDEKMINGESIESLNLKLKQLVMTKIDKKTESYQACGSLEEVKPE